MKASKKCLEMLAHHEGVRQKPYRCPAGLWTVGVGHLIGDGHSLPDSWNRTFSLEEVYAILAADVTRFERGVERFITIPLKQSEFDCLVSFAFNLGLGTLQKSTLRQKLNRGDKEGAIESLLKYNKAGGKILKGLDNRRKDEAKLFLS
jgi:GH24 family phage-related lysozyme (muramidase)